MYSSYFLPAAPSVAFGSDMVNTGGISPDQSTVHARSAGRREQRKRTRAPPLQEEAGWLHYLPPRGRRRNLHSNPRRRGGDQPPKKRNATQWTNANQMDGVNGGGMDWWVERQPPGPFLYTDCRARVAPTTFVPCSSNIIKKMVGEVRDKIRIFTSKFFLVVHWEVCFNLMPV
jgi:hypothetical protein